MNWHEEYWIKLYRRASPSFLSMSWRARGLFRLIMTEVDPNGRLELGKLGLKAVAVAVRAPFSEIDPFLQECIADGCLAVTDDGAELYCPNFAEAQRAASSSRARSQKHRSVKKASTDDASAVTEQQPEDTCVTPASRAVTSRHAESRGVTPRHDQIRREEKREEQTSGSGARVPEQVQAVPPSRVPIPDDWEPKPWHLDVGRELRMPDGWVQEQAKRFIANAESQAKVSAKWDQEFNGWLRSPYRTVEREAANRNAVQQPVKPKPTKYFEPPPEMTAEQYAASARAAERARAQLGGASA